MIDVLDNPKLSPCPFCGAVPVITKHFRDDVYSFMHRCKVVGVISRDFASKAQTHIDMWNTRVPPAAAKIDMASVMAAIVSIPGMPMLTSNQCASLAAKLNEGAT